MDKVYRVQPGLELIDAFTDNQIGVVAVILLDVNTGCVYCHSNQKGEYRFFFSNKSGSIFDKFKDAVSRATKQIANPIAGWDFLTQKGHHNRYILTHVGESAGADLEKLPWVDPEKPKFKILAPPQILDVAYEEAIQFQYYIPISTTLGNTKTIIRLVVTDISSCSSDFMNQIFSWNKCWYYEIREEEHLDGALEKFRNKNGDTPIVFSMGNIWEGDQFITYVLCGTNEYQLGSYPEYTTWNSVMRFSKNKKHLKRINFCLHKGICLQ